MCTEWYQWMLMHQYLIGLISMFLLFAQISLTIPRMKTPSLFSITRMAPWFPVNDSIQYKDDYYFWCCFSIVDWTKRQIHANYAFSLYFDSVWTCTELITHVIPNYYFSNESTQGSLQRESCWEPWFFLIGEYCLLMLRNIGVCSSGQHGRVKDSLTFW